MLDLSQVQFSSVQDGTYLHAQEGPYVLYHSLFDSGPFLPFEGRLMRGFLFQCLFPQHLRPSETQAISGGYFAHQSVCWVISLDSGISIKVHPWVSLKVDVGDWCIPVWASHYTFHLLWQTYWVCEDDGVCILSPLKAVQCDRFHFQDLVQIYMLNLSQAQIKGKNDGVGVSTR